MAVRLRAVLALVLVSLFVTLQPAGAALVCDGIMHATHPFGSTAQPTRLSAFSRSDIWVVGKRGPIEEARGFAWHSNGYRWSRVAMALASRFTPRDVVALDGVAYAVGALTENGGDGGSAIESWDGARWRVDTVPKIVRQSTSRVWSIGAAGDEVWAFGYVYRQGRHESVAIHRESDGWVRVPSPTPPNGDDGGSPSVADVLVLGPGDVWVVGSSFPFGEELYSMHWDGTTWELVPMPSFTIPGSPLEPDSPSLSGLGGSASDDVWAVGALGSGGGLVLHWDGSTWSQIDSPGEESIVRLRWVVSSGPDRAWVTGSEGNGPTQLHPLSAAWDGTVWSPALSPAASGFGNLVLASSDRLLALGGSGGIGGQTKFYEACGL